MDIGFKIKNARIKAEFTQEQAAEALGVSRQTVSNWENEKTYPDIISVVKMSDLYTVSLDELLKGKAPVPSYLHYLEESTNIVKSKTRISRLILILSYFAVWLVAVLSFWLFGREDVIGYTIMALYIILPVATFVTALLIGKNDYYGKWKWFSALLFGIMYMLAGSATFDAANTIAFHKINMPEFIMIPIDASVAMFGLVIGFGIYKLKSKKETGSRANDKK